MAERGKKYTEARGKIDREKRYEMAGFGSAFRVKNQKFR